MLNLAQQVAEFFSLEALDERLAPPSDKVRKQSVQSKANQVSKWGTLEFKFYYSVFAVCIPWMWKAAMDASNESNPNYPRYAHLLSNGWIFGRKVDNSDSQYRFFRDNFFLLFGLIIIHTSLRRLVQLGLKFRRTSFDFFFGILFLFGAHGFNCLRIVGIISISYSIAKYIPDKKIALWLTWIYGVSTLFFNDRYYAVPLGINAIDQGFKGIISRWDVFYGFTLLRMISFNLDYIEKVSRSENKDIGKPEKAHESNLVDLNEKERLVAPIPIADYNFFNFFAYITYTPLFIAGPIITFNDFIYQSNYHQLSSVKNFKYILRYFMRFLFCLLTMEFILHYVYVVAVSKTKSWQGDTPFQISMIGMFNLNIIWLKLLIPWRLFRFWSLLDGIDPPENMIRCMDNNFSALAFWRAWHRSYNKWLSRYIYIPMGGGGKYRIMNSLFVFSFVAIWHDIKLKLLMWGWLVVIFLLPEIIATSSTRRFANEWWYRYLCGLGAVLSIWMMMLANLFGFCLGKEGILSLLHDMFSTASGITFLLSSSFALFVGSQIMFEIRESEKRKGIDLRC